MSTLTRMGICRIPALCHLLVVVSLVIAYPLWFREQPYLHEIQPCWHNQNVLILPGQERNTFSVCSLESKTYPGS